MLESLTLVTQANTISEKLKKFLVQWTELHSQCRRPLSTRLVQGKVVDTFKDLEASASVGRGKTRFTEETKSQSKSERFMSSDIWYKLKVMGEAVSPHSEMGYLPPENCKKLPLKMMTHKGN